MYTKNPKVMILTGLEDRHFYLCNKLIEELGLVTGIIIGAKKTGHSFIFKLKTKIRHPVSTIKNYIYNKIYYYYGDMFIEEKKMAEDFFFGGSKKLFFQKYSHFILAELGENDKNINEKKYVNLIKKNKPDIIVVMGTCLISNELINTAPYVINLHTGLSPYYRGGNTNFWPYIYGDFDCFGVTVHKMSSGIDSGDIYFTSQIPFNINYNYGTINCLSIIEGVKLIIQSINFIKSGHIKSKQQWEEGKLFNGRDMNNYKAYQYYKIRKSLLLGDNKFLYKKTKFSIKIVKNGMILNA